MDQILSYLVAKSRSTVTSKDAMNDCLEGEADVVKNIKNLISITHATKLYSVAKTTFYYGINRQEDHPSYGIMK